MKASREILLIILFLLIVTLLNHVVAEQKDSDMDGIIDSEDEFPFDYDNDGMPDIWEKRNGLRYDAADANEDPDNDGIKNIDEYKAGTNPLLSAKTGEAATPPILLSPVETTMARGLIWIGAGALLLFIVIFILYRVHIFRILRFVHHASKEHEAKQAARLMPRHKRYIPRHPAPTMASRQMYPPQGQAPAGRPPLPPIQRMVPGTGQNIQQPLRREAFRPLQTARKIAGEQPLASREPVVQPFGMDVARQRQKMANEQPLAERVKEDGQPEIEEETEERVDEEAYELPKRRGKKTDAFGQLSKQIEKYRTSRSSLEELQDLAR